MCERVWEERLTTALTDDRPAPALLLVEGSAGIGKTRLVHRLLESLPACTASRLVLSFQPSGGVLGTDPDVPASAAGRLPAEPRPAPAALEGRVAADARAPAGTRPAHRTLAAALASERPALLVAEDLHHADARCLELLRALLREPPARFAAVLTYRPEQLATPGLPLAQAVDYPARLSVTRGALRPLDEAQVRVLAGELLGAQRCPREFVARLHRRSGGVPQVVVDLLAALRDAGGDRQHFTAADVDEAGVPVRLAERVLAAVASLPAPQRPVVWAAAVLEEAAGAQDLAAVAGLEGEAAHAALVAALECAALAEITEGRYGFEVPLAASAVSTRLPGPVRQQLHRRAAAMLAGRNPAPWARIARHWRAGGRTEDWLRAAEHLVDDRGAPDGPGGSAACEDEAAVTLLEQALGAGGIPPERRGRLALTLARGAMLGLRSEGTVQVLRRIVEDPALPTTTRGEIRLELGLLLHNRKRRFEEGRRELQRAARELAERPALAAHAMAALANPFFPGPPLAENLDWLRRAEEAAEASGDATARTAVAACRATVLMNAGDPEAWELVNRLPREGPDRVARQQVARGLCNTASGAVFLGHYRRADALLTEGVALAERSGAPFLERVGCGTELFRDWLTGRWDGLAERCTGLVAEDGTASDARVVLALLALARGEWTAAQNWLPPEELVSAEACEAPLAATAAGARVRLLLGRQQTEAAASAAEAAWDGLRRKGVWVWGAELAPWVVEAHARAGRPAEARAVVDAFAAGLTGRDAPSAAAALTWSRALLAEADGEVERAAAGFRDAAAAYARLPHPYARALTTEGAGRCAPALRGGAAETVVGELSACVELLTDLGASWDAARVRATLRTHRPASRRRRPGRPAYDQRMSPREAEVAELAASGLTNREIAGTLHLSPRTVEQHVARAMRKLGVDSRLALAEHASLRGPGEDT